MNKQQIFDKVILGLMSQEFELSWSDDQSCCMYRGDNGAKCAVGHLIPDSLYDPEMERKDVWTLYDTHPEMKKVVPLKHVGMLSDLQEWHDYCLKDLQYSENEEGRVIAERRATKTLENICNEHGVTL